MSEIAGWLELRDLGWFAGSSGCCYTIGISFLYLRMAAIRHHSMLIAPPPSVAHNWQKGWPNGFDMKAGSRVDDAGDWTNWTAMDASTDSGGDATASAAGCKGWRFGGIGLVTPDCPKS